MIYLLILKWLYFPLVIVTFRKLNYNKKIKLVMIQTSNLYFISSKYLANMLKGIIIQKNIHFCMRVSRCTTAKLFPISVSYLSRPICPLCLFWIKFVHNNRDFFERKRRRSTLRVTRPIIQSIHSINPNAYFLFYYYHFILFKE